MPTRNWTPDRLARRREKNREYQKKLRQQRGSAPDVARVYAWRAAARRRGVCLKRLREPRSLAAWAARLRWSGIKSPVRRNSHQVDLALAHERHLQWLFSLDRDTSED